MTDPYLSAAEFKNSASVPDGLADADVDRALMAASRAVEKLTERRSFHPAQADTVRRYTATNGRLVRIDDAYAITTVTSDGTEVDSSAYLAEPLNAPDDGEPYLWLEAVTSPCAFSCVRGAIQVTGRFGWPEVPPQVEQFVAIIAAKLLKRSREAPFGVANVGGLDGQAIRLAKTDPDAMLLIDPLTRTHPAVA